MVGRGGLEPPTSRLSGVRSNHLSYRPCQRSDIRTYRGPWPGSKNQTPAQLTSDICQLTSESGKERRGGWWPSEARKQNPETRRSRVLLRPLMLSSDAKTALSHHFWLLSSGFWLLILRKEVIQPQVPLRLPCYDFTPVADLTVVGCLQRLAHRLRVKPTPMV